MTSQELSNMIFNIKDKITDKEFKDIMDKLSVKHNEEQQDTYELRYVKFKTVLGVTEDSNIAWKMIQKIKNKKVKVDSTNLKAQFDVAIEKYNGNFDEYIIHGNIWLRKVDGVNKLYYSNTSNEEWLRNYDTRTGLEEDELNGIYLVYKNILPISIKKL
jgi:hypothetical protein